MQQNLTKNALITLGKDMQDLTTEAWQDLIELAQARNRWFTADNIHFALTQWAFALTEINLDKWLAPYNLPTTTPRKIGVVMAGNIPLVGFHDLLCVLLSGHIAYAKPSQDDEVLIRGLVDRLIAIEPTLQARIQVAEQLKEVEAYIATGSDNTARHFEYYFRNKPHIIRKNRVSVAVLNGKETLEDMEMLMEDITQYFGLGCRSIAKLFVPKGYDFTAYWQALEAQKNIANTTKYFNNYEYQRAAYLINSIQHLDNGFMILRENAELASPTGVMYYSVYEDKHALEALLATYQEKLQVVVSKDAWLAGSTHFGTAQQPALWDYADGVDTLAFLLMLK